MFISYLNGVNEMFDLCVQLLHWMAAGLGMTYKEINVWLFVIIHPLLTVYLFYVALKYWRLKRQLKAIN